MASKVSSSSASAVKLESSAAPEISDVKDGSYASGDISSVIDSLKKQVSDDRYTYIKRKMDENKQKLSSFTQHVYNLSKSRRDSTINGTDVEVDLLTKRRDDAHSTLNSLEQAGGEKDGSSCQDECSTVLLGNSFGGKNAPRPIKLPEVPKLPPYTTWIFLDRNQRMAEDQSVVGRRRIYYDQNCGEALICSDSEDDVVEEEEEKKEFGSAEDYIIRKTIEEVGSSDAALDLLAQFFERNITEIRARYDSLRERERTDDCLEKENDEVDDAFLEKDLEAALDSFDNLFCRRCLVFDCRLHGCSQDLVFPAEKQLPWSNPDEGKPCGIHCYRMASKSESSATVNCQVPHVFEEPTHSSASAGQQCSPNKKSQGSSVGRRAKSHQSESASSNARVVSESSESEVHPCQDGMSIQPSSSPSKMKQGGKCGVRKRNNKRVAEQVLVCIRKRQKKMVPSDSDSVVSGCLWSRDMKLRSNTRNGNKDSSSSSQNKTVNLQSIRNSRKKSSPHQDSSNSAPGDVKCITGEMAEEQLAADAGESSRNEEFVDENTSKNENPCVKSWKAIEQSLFAKGLEIFGRNSCLIARNLLSGMKTCIEVFQYMNYLENKGACRAADGANLPDGHAKGNELLVRSRFLRRRGRVHRLKYTWKSAGYHSIRKRISERKDQPCRQYNPCGCPSACGKQCPCLLNGTCYEKYCGVMRSDSSRG